MYMLDNWALDVKMIVVGHAHCVQICHWTEIWPDASECKSIMQRGHLTKWFRIDILPGMSLAYRALCLSLLEIDMIFHLAGDQVVSLPFTCPSWASLNHLCFEGQEPVNCRWGPLGSERLSVSRLWGRNLGCQVWWGTPLFGNIESRDLGQLKTRHATLGRILEGFGTWHSANPNQHETFPFIFYNFPQAGDAYTEAFHCTAITAKHRTNKNSQEHEMTWPLSTGGYIVYLRVYSTYNEASLPVLASPKREEDDLNMPDIPF